MGFPGGSVVNISLVNAGVIRYMGSIPIISNILAWKIPRAEKPGGLPSMES